MAQTVSGKKYLEDLAQEYNAYRTMLATLSERAFEYQKKIHSNVDNGVAGFLADFALGFEERRRNLVRWKTGTKLPTAPQEEIDKILRILPRFVIFNSEAVGGMKIEPARSQKIDIPVEQIMYEISKRLSKKMDVYRYHQDYATETIYINGIGNIEVTLWQHSDGVFTTISSVRGKDFYIWNCRDSGVVYLDRYNEISRPSAIEIQPLNLKFSAYSDGSGDEERSPAKFKRDQDAAIVWLVDNILNPLLKAPTPKKQIDVPEMEVPFPDHLFEHLYAFAPESDIEKIAILQQKGVDAAYPDERTAIHPSYRLIPLGHNTKGLPKEVHDGFIWCGIGKIEEIAQSKKHQIAKRDRDNWSLFSKEGIVEVKPLTATDIYVIDWFAWEDFRAKAFTDGKDRLNDKEVDDMYRSVGATLVPITEYNGTYKNPIVMIARKLEVAEIGKMFTFQD